ISTTSRTCKSASSRLGGIFDFDQRAEELEEVERELEDPDIWNDPERAQGLGQTRARLETIVRGIQQLEEGLTDSKDLLDMAAEESDEDTVEAVASDLDDFEAQVAKLEFQRMFSGELDASNCFVDIQSGSGGTEAQDWAEILLRMYLRWGERHGFKTELMECSAGEVAGIKSATISFSGDYAFGWLRTEIGVHRLRYNSGAIRRNKSISSAL
ncbi:unnamed protein product, partial [Cyprideis torosa]